METGLPTVTLPDLFCKSYGGEHTRIPPLQASAEPGGAAVVDRGAARPPQARLHLLRRYRPQGIVPPQVQQEQSTEHG